MRVWGTLLAYYGWWKLLSLDELNFLHLMSHLSPRILHKHFSHLIFFLDWLLYFIFWIDHVIICKHLLLPSLYSLVVCLQLLHMFFIILFHHICALIYFLNGALALYVVYPLLSKHHIIIYMCHSFTVPSIAKCPKLYIYFSCECNIFWNKLCDVWITTLWLIYCNFSTCMVKIKGTVLHQDI